MNFHCLQPLKVFPEWLVIFVAATFLHNGHNGRFRDKPGQIVNMTVCIIAGDAVAQPENIANTQVILQTFFDFIAREIRISILVQQT